MAIQLSSCFVMPGVALLCRPYQSSLMWRESMLARSEENFKSSYRDTMERVAAFKGSKGSEQTFTLC